MSDPVLIIGTATSVVLGVLFYARSDTKTALGVLAGLIGIVVSLQIQAVLLSQKRIDNANKYARIENAFDEIEWLAPTAQDLIRSATSINSSHTHPQVVELCQQIFGQCQERLNDLQRGHYEPTYGDQRLFLDLTQSVVATMRATSAQNVDLSWWTSARSDDYWRLQRDALARGVTITRIFIYLDWNADLESLASRQLAAGVDVRRVHHDKLPASLVADVVLWDSSSGYETRSNAGGEPVENFFTFAAQDVDAMAAKYKQVLGLAEMYAAPLQPPP